MKQQLSLTLLGEHHPNLIPDLSALITELNCNIDECRVNLLGDTLAGLMLISGHWGDIAKLEAAIPKFEKSHNMVFTLRRTQHVEYAEPMFPYLIHIIAMDKPGIIQHVSTYFESEGIHVSNISCEQYSTQHTETDMTSLCFTINVPKAITLSEFRDRFITFCDELNIDAMMEPCKT